MKSLESFVQEHLPYYSVPQKWTYLSSIPLTSNGKVNKNQLRLHAVEKTLAVDQTESDSSKESLTPAPKDVSVGSTLVLCQPISYSSDSSKDMEKGGIMVTRKESELSAPSLRSSIGEIPDALPAKNGLHGLRWLRHRAFIVYRRFFSGIIFVNIAVACFLLYRKIKEDRYILADLATATAANLCVAVLMRSEPVVNLLFTVFCSVPVCSTTVQTARDAYTDFVFAKYRLHFL
jgi:hypothetical protein